MATPGIYQKIAAIQEEVGTIPKNGRGPQSKGSFEFVRFDDVVLKVRDLMVEHGVIQSVETLEHNVQAVQVGNRMVVNSWARVKYTWTDTEDGSTHYSIVGGEGSDIGGDTATRKAFTQALKIVLLQTFNIVTGEEPDSDGNDPADIPMDESAPAAPKGDTIESVRAKIVEHINDASSPYTKESINALGDKVTGKARDKWFSSVPDLKKVLAAVEAGEVA